MNSDGDDRGSTSNNEADQDEAAPEQAATATSNQGKKVLTMAELLRDKFPSDDPNLNNAIQTHQPPRHPNYLTKEARLKTYELWPTSLSQRPQQLSGAGFYYTGRGDRVICYQCGGGLKDWGCQDDPYVEHAQWFPDCYFIKLVKGQEFIDQVKQMKNAQQQNVTQTSSELSTSPVTITNVNERSTTVNQSSDLLLSEEAFGGPELLTERRRSQQQARLCKVCLEQDLAILFLPCCHLATCADCSAQLSDCVICRERFNAYVRVFLP